MKTYYVAFEVIPTLKNQYFALAKGALAACWVLGDEPQAAHAEAAFFVATQDWKIARVETPPMEVTRDHFTEKDIGLEQYDKAQEEGISLVYAACARDGKTTAGPIALKASWKLDLSVMLKKQKQLSGTGRCLHFDGGRRCEQIVSAHSIQRSQSLSAICRDSHVYTLSTSMSSLKRNKGQLSYEKRGVNTVSTFLGFCKKHDNELFEPIDKHLLYPTDQQVILYEYRSLCRELFVKENVFRVLDDQLRKIDDKNATIDLLKDLRTGTAWGLSNLKDHKTLYDESLRGNKFDDIRYVLFVSEQKPCLAFTGLFYPDFDFLGRHLQDLGDHATRLELITICSAPMASGWGFLFAWHQSSSRVCSEFMRSLATMVHGGAILGDSLFRMVVSNCENLAVAPEWWESLPSNHKERIIARVSGMANSFAMTKHTYLCEGLDGITQWQFERVLSHME